MKTLSFIFTTLMTLSLAQAEVKVPGTFVPTECSAVRELNGISQNPLTRICAGKITGLKNQKAFSLQRLYSPTQIVLVQSQETLSRDDRQLSLTYYLVNQSGTNAGAMVATYDLATSSLMKVESTEESAIEWVADSFEIVFVTQKLEKTLVPIIFE